MNKTLLKNLKFLALGIMLAVGVSYVNAGTFNPAPGSPFGGNTDTPLNVSTTDQVKGCATPMTCGITGDLWVHTFAASANAQFEQNVTFGGMMLPGIPGSTSATDIRFGGTDPLGVSRLVNLLFRGDIESKDAVTINTLANPDLNHVCADQAGNLVLCAAPVVPPAAVCAINTFTANPTAVVYGNYTTLAWTTTNCDTATINGALQASPNGSDNWGLTTTTTFTLYASNATSNDTATLTVTVSNPSCDPGFTYVNGSCKLIINATASLANYSLPGDTCTSSNYRCRTYVLKLDFGSGAPTYMDYRWGYCQTQGSLSIPSSGVAWQPRPHCLGFAPASNSDGNVIPYQGSALPASRPSAVQASDSIQGNRPSIYYGQSPYSSNGPATMGTTIHSTGMPAFYGGTSSGFMYEIFYQSGSNFIEYDPVNTVILYGLKVANPNGGGYLTPSQYQLNLTSGTSGVNFEVR